MGRAGGLSVDDPAQGELREEGRARGEEAGERPAAGVWGGGRASPRKDSGRGRPGAKPATARVWGSGGSVARGTSCPVTRAFPPLSPGPALPLCPLGASPVPVLRSPPPGSSAV